MVLSIAKAVGVFGILFSVSVALFHVYRAARARDTVEETLASYYTLSIPYVGVSGALTAFFFAAVAFPAELSGLLGSQVLVDVAFLGLTLVWLGGVYRVFHATDMLSDSFFAKGDRGGD